jgi:purine-binding chemotaxis protein CheW
MRIRSRRTDGPATNAETVLLRTRAAELAHGTTEIEPEDEGLAAAMFSVGEEIYAIPLEHLRAAIPLTAVTPIPQAPPHVIGIVRFRGQAVTALSFAAIFGVGGWRVDPGVLVVLEGPDARLIAVDCEHIPRAVTLPLAPIAVARSARTGPVVELALPDIGRVMLLDDLRPLFGAFRGRGENGRGENGRGEND